MYTLVTGGAGYIGSHFVDLFAQRHDHILIIDNLNHGFKDAITTVKARHPKREIIFRKIDLKDYQQLERYVRNFSISTVVHFAALCRVDQSIHRPDQYFENNTCGTINLLNVMAKHKIHQFIFSSTCATYGETQYLPVDENHPQNPTNPYGQSKLLVEQILPWYEMAFKIKYIILRYFNVCGASPSGQLGFSKRLKQSLLVQDAVRGALGIHPLHLTYSDVDTPDKSPIRDYVDVLDLVDAHIKAIQYLKKNQKSNIFNLGTGKGNSVKDIISQVENVLNTKIIPEKGHRRKGEYAKIYAANDKAKRLLKWSPKISLSQSISNLANWYRSYPNGFKK